MAGYCTQLRRCMGEQMQQDHTHTPLTHPVCPWGKKILVNPGFNESSNNLWDQTSTENLSMTKPKVNAQDCSYGNKTSILKFNTYINTDQEF